MNLKYNWVCQLFAIWFMANVDCGQPIWNLESNGNSIYAISTDTWQECGLLCTKNLQKIERGLQNTECLYWTWSDPSNREYDNVCRFHGSEATSEYNGHTISGPSGCYSLSTC